MESEAVRQAIVLEPAGSAGRAGGVRLRGAILAVACWGVLGVACCLTPRHVGFGTHEQFGLPPCTFLAVTGWPCPSCGLTTSFAAMAKGRIGQAVRAHPFGAVLFAGALVVGIVSLGELVCGRDLLRLLRPGAGWAIGIAAGLLIGWTVKLLVGWAAGTLPLR